VKQKSQKRPKAGKNAAKATAMEPDNRRFIWGICVILAVMVWVVFGQTRYFDFVNFDDGKYVSGNSSVIAGVTAKSMASAFGTAGIDNWVPLTTISHMADCQVYGLNAGDHHLTNTLLHGATVILLFLALVKLTSRENIWRCAFVAAVFAIHPLRAESVAWVSERKDVLCGVFFMLTLWCYAGYAKERGVRDRWSLAPPSLYLYWGTLSFAACALMSKPVAITLPFVLLLLDYWPLGRFGNVNVWRLLAEKVPFLLLSLLACLPTILTEKPGIAAAAAIPIPLRIENVIVSYVTYIGELFYPAQLSAFYRYPIEGLPFREVAAAFLFLAAVTAIVVMYGKKRPYL
jgi:hypothetical protein